MKEALWAVFGVTGGTALGVVLTNQELMSEHPWVMGLIITVAMMSGIGAAVVTSQGRESQPTVSQASAGAHSPNIIAMEQATVNLHAAPVVESTSLCDAAPKVILGFVREPLYTGFNVWNRGGSDALEVRLRPVESPNYRLSSETIRFLEHGNPLKHSLRLIAEDKKGGTILKGEEAWEAFALDMWVLNFPLPKADPGDLTRAAEVFNKAFHDMTSNKLMFNLHVDYTDLSGMAFESPAQVIWIAIGKRTDEVRPGPIRRIAA